MCTEIADQTLSTLQTTQAELVVSKFMISLARDAQHVAWISTLQLYWL